MTTTPNHDRARALRVDMLNSLRKVRAAYQLYLRAWDECRDQVREHYRYAPGEQLSSEHEKLAEQNADRHPVTLSAVTQIKTHQPLALTYGVAYLVEVDYAWRFGDEHPDGS